MTVAAPATPTATSTRTIVIGAGAVIVCAVAFALSTGSSTPTASTTTPATVAQSAAGGTDAAERRSFGEVPVPEEFTAADFARSGVAAYNSGDLAAAAEKLLAAVEADPNNAELLNNLGQVLVRQGKARDAIAYFDRAIAVSGEAWAYHFNRARAYAELKDWSKAIDGYNVAARLFPNDYVTQFNLARARQESGDLAGAVESYAKAAELAPGQADFQLWYGRALDLSGRKQDAVAAYKRFLELEPNAPQAEKVKARLAQLGEPQSGAPSQPS